MAILRSGDKNVSLSINIQMTSIAAATKSIFINISTFSSGLNKNLAFILFYS